MKTNAGELNTNPLDASMVRSSIGNLLKMSASMSQMSQTNEITSAQRSSSTGENLMMRRPLGRVRNACNGNKNEVFDLRMRPPGRVRNACNGNKNEVFDLTMRPLGRVRNACNGNKNEVFDKLSASMSQMSQMSQPNEITSVQRSNSIGENLTMRPLGSVRNAGNGNKNEVFDCGNTAVDDNDYFYLDIENETEIPLEDDKYSPSSHSPMTCAGINDEQPVGKAAVSTNVYDSNGMLKKDSMRRCQSMSKLYSSFDKNSIDERRASVTDTPEGGSGLRRVSSHSILKSSSAYTDSSFDKNSIDERRASVMDTPEGGSGLKRVSSYSILKSSSAYTDTPQEQQLRRSTSFSTLEIREYAITLGDNPGGARGPPISLDWEYDEGQTQLIPLEDYEILRPPRRKRNEMHMAENLRRWRLLREKGYTLKEMNRATKAAETVRRQRMKSIQPSPVLSKLKKKIGQLISSSTNEIDSYHAQSVA